MTQIWFRLGFVYLALLLIGTPLHAAEIPITPEKTSFKVGILPWLGFGPYWLAQEKGLFKKHGLDNVELINFAEDKDMDAALVSGQIDAGLVPTSGAMLVRASGTPCRIVLQLDVSLQADAIVSDKITKIEQMKGMTVAYEEGSTSDVLLNYALEKAGLTIDDVTKAPMPAAQAGGAIIAGQVPVAVTYEPYLTSAMNRNPKVKIIFEAGVDPGVISDVLVVRQDRIDAKPGVVLAMVKAWDDAIALYRSNVPEGRAMIARAVGDTPEDLKTAFDGVVFYSVAENKQHLTSDFRDKVAVDVQRAAIHAKFYDKEVDLKQLVDGDFVDAASK